jgi:hypothetical protein
MAARISTYLAFTDLRMEAGRTSAEPMDVAAHLKVGPWPGLHVAVMQ